MNLIDFASQVLFKLLAREDQYTIWYGAGKLVSVGNSRLAGTRFVCVFEEAGLLLLFPICFKSKHIATRAVITLREFPLKENHVYIFSEYTSLSNILCDVYRLEYTLCMLTVHYL